MILEQAEQIARAVPLLEERSQAEVLRAATQEIHRLENEGDDLLADAIATLYDGVTEVPQLIFAMRWNDLYQLLEDTTDKAENVATVAQHDRAQERLSVDLAVLLITIALGLAFDFINGFHDTANAIATVVATRVLSPGRAVLMAGVLELRRRAVGTAVATTVGKGIISPEVTDPGAGDLGADRGHRLEPGHVVLRPAVELEPRADLQPGRRRGGHCRLERDRVQRPAEDVSRAGVLAAAGLSAASCVMLVLLNLFAHAFPATVTHIFGRAQLLSAAYMAFSHGSNDAQKTMGVMTMALATYLHWGGTDWQVPLWIIVSAAHGDGPRHVDRRLADHPHRRPARGAAAADPRLCRRNGRGDRHRGRQSAGRARLDNAYD